MKAFAAEAGRGGGRSGSSAFPFVGRGPMIPRWPKRANRRCYHRAIGRPPPRRAPGARQEGESQLVQSKNRGIKAQSAPGRPCPNARNRINSSMARNNCPPVAGLISEIRAIPPMVTPEEGVVDDAQCRRHADGRPPQSRPSVADLQEHPRGQQTRQRIHDPQRSDRNLIGPLPIRRRIVGVNGHQAMDEVVERRMRPLEQPGEIHPALSRLGIRKLISQEWP